MTQTAETALPPKLSHRAAALRVVVGLTLTGALGGVLWAFLAPPVDAVVALTKKGQRIHGYFGAESDRVFLGGALAVGLLTVIAVVTATLVWQWRAHRGPLLAGALALGNVAAAGALTGVGAVVAGGRPGRRIRADPGGVPARRFDEHLQPPGPGHRRRPPMNGQPSSTRTARRPIS